MLTKEDLQEMTRLQIEALREEMVDFLIEHDLLILRKLEHDCNIPQTVLSKVTRNKIALAKKHMPKLHEALYHYGYRSKVLNAVNENKFKV